MRVILSETSLISVAGIGHQKQLQLIKRLGHTLSAYINLKVPMNFVSFNVRDHRAIRFACAVRASRNQNAAQRMTTHCKRRDIRARHATLASVWFAFVKA
ncbi:unnamed protein product [Darwinula stevensoni]|uniref:Uncharacterized protein n=1 Tax=Darwinula stevensoni TaxID=69355 RepID=A0A7R9A423_9CRUS|nr:unnamed protein product [Darwinula stevensoni]CAG0892758.1 unnamed protein product [Darwinula stevensoni]